MQFTSNLLQPIKAMTNLLELSCTLVWEQEFGGLADRPAYRQIKIRQYKVIHTG